MDHKNLEEFIRKHGIDAEVIGFSDSTRTVEQAEMQLGITKNRIAKSVVFIVKKAGKPLLVIAPGDRKVDQNMLKRLLDSKIRLANGEEVERYTGYVVGGVPPLGHASDIETMIDRNVLLHEFVWCGGGDRTHLLKIRPKEVERMQKAKVMEACI